MGLLWSWGFACTDKLKYQLETKYNFKKFSQAPEGFTDIAKFFIKDFSCYMFVDLMVYPLEILLTKLSADAGKVREYANPLDCLTKIVSQNGLKGLYVGFSIKLVH